MGYFDIGMIDQVPTKNLEDLVDNIPVKRLGKPKNIIKTVKFLLRIILRM